MIPEENPCPIIEQDLAFQQPCTSIADGHDTKVVIVTFRNRKSCTSKLNLQTHDWERIPTNEVNIPIGGHLMTSIDGTRVFYLGGIYYEPREVQSLDIFELTASGWTLIVAKLPFQVSSNETKSYPSLHNVTLD